MKKLIYSFYTIFLIGFILKFFHIHFNAIIMMTGIAGVLVLSIIQLFRKKESIFGLLNFGTIIWLVVLLISLKFFPYGFWFLLLAIIISNVILIIFYRNKMMNKLIFFFIAIILALTFYFIPTDNRYYILNIKWNHEIESDFYSWDKYSWFLYQNGKYTEALIASDRALNIVESQENEHMLNFIENHQSVIRNRNWEKYR